MPRRIPCNRCGRTFTARGGGPPRDCPKCRAAADGEVAGVHRAKCRQCGNRFETPSRSVKYCSPACRHGADRRRDRAYKRARRADSAAAASAGTASTTASAKPPAAKCRVCGKELRTGGLGPQRSYCSPACGAEGSRTLQREYKRRYFDDPDRRSIQAARARASYARKRAATAKDRVAQCRECGATFLPETLHIAYCSDTCRKKAAARRVAANTRRRTRLRSSGGGPAASRSGRRRR